jgi:spore cortex formation protein SpoVR/YcgB (stage V sporulation)
MSNQYLWEGSDWTFKQLDEVYNACETVARDELGLSYYPNQLEIISSEQMLDAYTSIGMPIYYKHWSFGKHFISEQRNYQKGHSGLAYELVINSNPCINYLMEDNSMTTQALVIAHAAFGHNHFFKNNYLFKQWTDASSIVDYLIFARDYIEDAEQKYGQAEVESWLDSCHALMDYGVNRYQHPTKLSVEKEKARQRDRADYLQTQVDELYRILPESKNNNKKDNRATKPFPEQPEENLLYFFEKFSPDLEVWQRELLRIVRKIAQYFYPQAQTKVMNEGFASLTHYEILNRLHDKGLTSPGSHLEFLHLHSNVLYQPDYDKPYYSGMNPYSFGFAMLRDIQRMCNNPTEEDQRWFGKAIAGKRSQDLILEAVAEFRDESFIRQWLSPAVIRQQKLFGVWDDRADKDKYVVKSIHNDSGYERIRETMADQYLRASSVPQIEVKQVNRKNRTLLLQYTEHRGRKLANIEKMIPHLEKLWGGYPVIMVDHRNDPINRSDSASQVPSNIIIC